MDASTVPTGRRLLDIAQTLKVRDNAPLTLGTGDFAARAIAVLKRELASASAADFAAAFDVTKVQLGDRTIFDLAARGQKGNRAEAMLTELSRGFPRLNNKEELVAFERAASVAFGDLARAAGYAAGELRLEGHYEGLSFGHLGGVVLVVAADASAVKP